MRNQGLPTYYCKPLDAAHLSGGDVALILHFRHQMNEINIQNTYTELRHKCTSGMTRGTGHICRFAKNASRDWQLAGYIFRLDLLACQPAVLEHILKHDIFI